MGRRHGSGIGNRLRPRARRVSLRPRLERIEERILPVITVTSALDSGAGTLRDAIQQVNLGNDDAIAFQIGTGAGSIVLSTPLDPIIRPVTIDATTQPGFSNTPLISLLGGGSVANGLTLAAGSGGSAIRGLILSGFSTSALAINSSGNAIGGTASGAGNIFADNPGSAIVIDAGAGNAIIANAVYGNGAGIVLANNGNQNQPAPSGLTFTSIAGRTNVEGTITGSVPGDYRIDVFASGVNDPSGGSNLYARTYLGSILATLTAPGAAAFSQSFPLATQLDASQRLYATVTSPSTAAAPNANNTSTFAASGAAVDPFVVTTTASAGIGSLREALLAANANPDLNTITFAIPSAPRDIAPTAALPALTAPVVLDAVGASGVALVGTGLGASGVGLSLDAGSSGSTVRGLTFRGFQGSALLVRSGGNTLGGTANGAGNTFLGNPGTALRIEASAVTSNLVIGNTIGASGQANGTGIAVAGASGNTIGGTNVGQANTLAFNTLAIGVDAGSGNLISGNAIFGNTQAITLTNNGNQSQAPLAGLAFTSVGTAATFQGTVSGAAAGSYTVEFFAGGVGDPSTPPYARTYLGRTTVVLVAPGSTGFVADLTVPLALQPGQAIYATVTSPTNDTSPLATATSATNPFVVTSTVDTATAPAIGTLRRALIQANLTTALDVISFAIPGGGPYVVTVGASLPDIVHPVAIDGTTQPGFATTPIVELDGNALAANGLTLAPGSAGSTIRGLVIRHFAGAGIRDQSGSNTIAGNYLGTDAPGSAAGPGNLLGIWLDGASGTTVGGTAPGAGNLISGNTTAGVRINGSGSGNIVRGNRIGTNAAATATLGNPIGVEIQGASGTRVGGTAAGAGNILGGANQAISVGGATATGTVIEGNLIGTNAAGVNLGNATGIIIVGVPVTVGGTATGAGNTIGFSTTAALTISTAGASGSVVAGNLIGTNAGGAALTNAAGVAIDDASDVAVGGTAAGAANTIANTTGAAVRVTTGTGNLISRNLLFANGQAIVLASGGNAGQPAPSNLGFSAAGSVATVQGTVGGVAGGNYVVEFFLNNAADTPGVVNARTFLGSTIVSVPAGGTNVFLASVGLPAPLSGNQVIFATVSSPSTAASPDRNNTSPFVVGQAVASPFIVTNTSDSGLGSLRQVILLANANPGLDTVSFNITPGAAPFTIGPASPLPSIVDPIFVDATTQPGYLGVPSVRLDGAGLGAGTDGLTLAAGSAGSTIRGLAITRFARAGIHVQSNGASIQSNVLGTDSTGTATGLGNQTGLWIENASATIVGALGSLGNLISGNTLDGLLVAAPAGSNILIVGNKIGTDLTGGAALPNGRDGIRVVGVAGAAAGVTIGGTTSTAANTIAFNTGAGITVDAVQAVSIRHNAVFGNSGPGIVLASGGNAGQPAPVLTTVNSAGGSTSVSGTLAGALPNTSYTIEFFAGSPTDPPSGDQARIFLGSTPVTTDGTGGASFTAPFPVALSPGQRVTATATAAAPALNTSPFAGALTVANALVVTNTNDAGVGSLRQAILNANASPGLDAITFAIAPAASTYTIALAAALPAITDAVVIDATSQAGYGGTPVIRLSGGGLSGAGLTLAAGSGGSVVKGLNIVNFAGAGIAVASDGNAIQGNTLGTDFAGGAAGPGALTRGVDVTGASNTIGGDSTSAANTIAFATAQGVRVTGGVGNAIRRNAIFSNNVGIALVSGGNAGQPAPVLASAFALSGQTTVQGQLTATAGTYTLEFFASTPSDPTTGDQARIFLGTSTVTVSASGTASFTATLPVAALNLQRVTATATAASATRNTSAFATPVAASSPFVVTNTNDSGLGSLRQAILNTNASPGLDAITFAIAPAASTYTIVLTSALPAVTDAVVIDATSQVDYRGTPVIRLSGGGGVSGAGLTLAAGSGGSVVKGLNIVNFAGAGIAVASDGNTIQGNTLGTDFVGVAAGPGALTRGVDVTGASNTIGGNTPGLANIIAFCTDAAVRVTGGIGNTIRGNIIFANPGGITLAGGGNANQPAPVLAPANSIAGSTTVWGTLPASAGTYVVEFFADDAGDPTSPIYARTPLGTIQVVVAGGSGATFQAVLPGGTLSPGQRVTATATSAAGSTSAFAASAIVVQPFVVINTNDAQAGSLRQAILNANARPGPDTISFNIAPTSTSYPITLTSLLPSVTETIVIDGTSQPGYGSVPVVQLNGNNLAGAGLTLGAGSGGSTIRGLSIVSFAGAGIAVQSDGNTIQGNLIGPKADGLPGSNSQGVVINGSNNVVGGASPNTIVRNTLSGVVVASGANNTISKNSIYLNGSNTIASATNDIVLQSGANNNAPAPRVVVSQYNETTKELSLSINFPSSFEFTDPMIVQLEVFQNNGLSGSPPDSRPFRIATTESVPITATGPNPSTVIDVTLVVPGFTSTSDVAILTATFFGAGGKPSGTSAFSNLPGTTDQFVVTTNADSGPGSLRNAIDKANEKADLNKITFAIVGADTTITLKSPLSPIQYPIDINATSQPGFLMLPVVQLVGAGLNAGTDGLVLALGSSGSTIRGLWIQAFAGAGIRDQSGSNSFVSNILGARDKDSGVGNLHGLWLDGASGSTVGDAAPGAGNIVSGNTGAGVYLSNKASSNRVQNALIGTDAAGTTAVGNGVGIWITGQDSRNNTVGSDDLTVVTLISGNTGHGVRIDGQATGNHVFNVRIGTNAAGTGALENAGDGVSIAGAGGNFIGRTEASLTVISGNRGSGIAIVGSDPSADPIGNTIVNTLIGTDLTGQNINERIGNQKDGILVTDAAGTVIGAAGPARNVIAGNGENGIRLAGLTSGTLVGNNFIGVDKSGQVSNVNLANKDNGILIEGKATGNWIGALAAGTPPDYAGNVISGNLKAGVRIESEDGKNTVVANRIGLNWVSSTQFDLGNAGNGIEIDASPDNQIGGLDPAAGNVISGNRSYGVAILNAGSTKNLVQGNTIGAGNVLTSIGNLLGGVFLFDARANTIGGVDTGAGNTIAGNQNDGVIIKYQFAAPDSRGGNTIQGNNIARNVGNGIRITRLDNPTPANDGPQAVDRIVANTIGTDATGTMVYDAARNLVLGNRLDGILLESIGATIDGNTISGNGISGIHVRRTTLQEKPDELLGTADLSSTVIVGNKIGVDKDGKTAFQEAKGVFFPLGNVLDGVLLDDVYGVVIGGGSVTDLTRANVISGNLGRGVEVRGQEPGSTIDPSKANVIQGNLIGTDASGQWAIDANHRLLSNIGDGIFLLDFAPTNVVGNVVSNNRGFGIHAFVANGRTSAQLYVIDNLVGTSQDGVSALGNGSDGIFLDSIKATSTSLLIQGNVVSGNSSNGVHLLKSSGVVIVSNTIGTNKTKTAALPNAAAGVFLNESGNNMVGGLDTTPDDAGNVISGNLGSGLFLSGLGAKGNTVVGNLVGTDGAGTAALPNSISGLVISQGTGNAIGFVDGTAGRSIRGNVLSGNKLYGVQLVNGAGGNTLLGNLIGADISGNKSLGNTGDGVFLSDASGNTIGGATVAERNIISGNLGNGVRIFASGSPQNTLVNAYSLQNTLVNTYIGVGRDGRVMGNLGNGLLIDLPPNNGNLDADADPKLANVIGGTTGLGNVISGNAMTGVMFLGSNPRAGVRLLGNKIGTDPSGRIALANGGHGVALFSSSNNMIGGAAAGQGNLISGNAQSGILILGAGVGSPATRNAIAGNFIGTDIAGSAALPNNGGGVMIFNASGNTVGGVTPTPGAGNGNVISGNMQFGVLILSAADNVGDINSASGNHITGNLIGTDAAGVRALANQGEGVYLLNAENNVIGRLDGRNVISGNKANGVLIDAISTRNASGNLLGGNYIGLDLAGRTAIGNGRNGVLISNAARGNFIGWAGLAAAGGLLAGTNVPASPVNVISGNTDAGIQFAGGTGNNTVEGNYIGVDREGRDSGGLGNTIGVFVNNQGSLFAGQVIGSGRPGGGNIIAGNVATRPGTIRPELPPVGILLYGPQNTAAASPNAWNNIIQGNLVGLDRDGRAAANLTGILVNESAYNLIGGAAASERNIISGNSQAGVRIVGAASRGNTLVGNWLGTDLTGINAAVTDPAKQQIGIILVNASGNTIGGTSFRDATTANVISGNSVGVQVSGTAGASAPGNNVQGNRIGTSATGTGAVANSTYGIFIDNAPNQQIRGNLVSGNANIGIDIFGSGSRGNVVTENRIGPDINGQSILVGGQLAQQHGLAIIGSSQNTIGLSGRGNTISFNRETGVYISRRDKDLNVYATPVNNLVRYNTIQNNGLYGVLRYDAPNNPVAQGGATRNIFGGGTQTSVRDYLTRNRNNTIPPTRKNTTPAPRVRAASVGEGAAAAASTSRPRFRAPALFAAGTRPNPIFVRPASARSNGG